MEEELINYGLSEKEAKVYLLLLKSGETTANRLIEISGMPRGTIYDVLERLKLRGLVSSFLKNKAAHFAANDLEVLIKDLDEKKIFLEKALPKIRKLKNTVSKSPTIEVFEGFSAIRKVLDDILDNCREVIIMGDEMSAREVAKHLPENFKVRRIEKKIHIKNLLEDSSVSRKLKNNRYSEVRYLKELGDSKAAIIIYNDTTVHMIMDEPVTIIRIVSSIHAKMQKIMFENIWKSAKK